MEGEFEFFDEDDIANAESEQHDIRFSGLGGLFRGECCGRGCVIGYFEEDLSFFVCLGLCHFSGGFFCPSAFSVVDVEEVLPDAGFFDESEAEGGFDESIEHFGCVECCGVFGEGFEDLLGGGEGIFVAEVEARCLDVVGDELCLDEVEFSFGVVRVGG